jgi:hypothetical protein
MINSKNNNKVENKKVTKNNKKAAIRCGFCLIA